VNTKKQKIRLGIFIFSGSLLIIALVIFFAANEIFEKTDTYYVSYHDVSVNGLEVGSPVNYLGIRIGSISAISIDPNDVKSVIVELSLQPGTPIKMDAYADIVAMGITGLKIIEIRGGSNDAKTLDKGDHLIPGSSVTEDITGKATIIAEKTEKVINNLQEFTKPENLNKYLQAADNLNLLVNQMKSTTVLIDSVISENRIQVRDVVDRSELIASNLEESSVKLNETLGILNEIVKSDTVRQIIGDAGDISNQLKEADFRKFIENLAQLANITNNLVARIDEDFDRSSRELEESLELLKITLSNLEEISNQINTDPSILVRGHEDKNIPDKRLK